MGVLTGNHSVLQIHPTRHCNLTCLHCYSLSGPTITESLPIDLLCASLSDAAALGYDVVSLSGGEPSLYPHLVDLLTYAKAVGLRTTMTTNGLPLSRGLLGQVAPVLDVLAISLDGKPATHDRMRNHPRAFELLDRRLPAIRTSGIPFGFITTLTLHNVHELAWVLDYADTMGAAFVQVHPLEATGAGAVNLRDSVPDEQEGVYALFEAARLAGGSRIPIQVDITTRSDLVEHPEQFHAAGTGQRGRLGDWLSPLVIQTDGSVVPLTYGMPSHLGLGDIRTDDLAGLADRWDPEPFTAVCRRATQRLLASDEAVFDWYGEVLNTARHNLEVAHVRT